VSGGTTESVAKTKQPKDCESLAALFDELVLQYRKRCNIEQVMPGILLQSIDRLVKNREAEVESRECYEAAVSSFRASNGAADQAIEEIESEGNRGSHFRDPKSPLETHTLKTLMEIRDQLSMCDSMIRASYPMLSTSVPEILSVG
jgi:hypothetical protein